MCRDGCGSGFSRDKQWLGDPVDAFVGPVSSAMLHRVNSSFICLTLDVVMQWNHIEALIGKDSLAEVGFFRRAPVVHTRA